MTKVVYEYMKILGIWNSRNENADRIEKVIFMDSERNKQRNLIQM